MDIKLMRNKQINHSQRQVECQVERQVSSGQIWKRHAFQSELGH